MGNRQSFFNGRMLFWGFGISLILNVANNGFWICEILGTIIGLLILLCVKKNKHPKFVNLINGFMMAFLAGSLLVNMGGTLYLKSSPTMFLALVPVIGGFIISMSRNIPLKRTVQLLFTYTAFMSIVMALFLVREAKPANMLPLFETNSKGVIYGTIVFVLASVTPILSMNEIKDAQDKKNMIINYLMSSLSVIVLSLLIVSVLGNKEAMLYRYPEYVVLKRIKVSEFFTNVDNILCVPMVVDMMITIATGIRTMGIQGKYSKYTAPLILFFAITYACSSSSLMTLLYTYFPLVLLSLLILTLIPKK